MELYFRGWRIFYLAKEVVGKRDASLSDSRWNAKNRE
jgi:hypothetical protein